MVATMKEAAVADLALKRLRGESIDKIADEIALLSAAVKKLMAQSRLTEETLLLLIQHAIPVQRKNAKKMSFRDIKAVLDGIEAMQTKYIKEKK
jgi:protein-tyrosine-phosphatase